MTVSAGGISSVTNQDGYFVLANVPMGNQVLTVAKENYLRTHRMVNVQEGRSTYYPDLMLVEVETAVVDATANSQVSVDGGKGLIDFTAGSFVTGDGSPYTGQVTVNAAAIRPDDDEFFGVFPVASRVNAPTAPSCPSNPSAS